MASVQTGAVWQQIKRLLGRGPVAGLSDGELLDRYAAGRDESAFEALLALHGAMVLGVCRRAHSTTRRTSRMPSRPRSSCSSAGPRRSGRAWRSGRGSTGSRAAWRCGRGRSRRGGGRASGPSRRSPNRPGRRTARWTNPTATKSPPRSTSSCRPSPRATARRSCSATSKAGRSPRPPSNWAGHSGRSRGDCREPANYCAAGSRGEAWRRPRRAWRPCWRARPGRRCRPAGSRSRSMPHAARRRDRRWPGRSRRRRSPWRRE